MSANLKRRFPIVRILAAIFVVLVLLHFVLGPPKPSDQEQLLDILSQVREGAAKSDIGEITAPLSSQFKFRGLTRLQLRFQLLQFFRENNDVAIFFNTPQELQIRGDTATMLVHVEVSGEHGAGKTRTTLYTGDVRLELAKEPTRRLLVIPDSSWKIIAASVPGADTTAGV